jgi:hypothetical protein
VSCYALVVKFRCPECGHIEVKAMVNGESESRFLVREIVVATHRGAHQKGATTKAAPTKETGKWT